MKNNLFPHIREAVKLVPEVLPLLSDKTLFMLRMEKGEYKTQEYFVQQIRRLVSSLYNKQIGGEFIDLMANLISGQLYDAYTRAWNDEEYSGGFPDYLYNAWQDDVLKQYDFVDQYYRDIVDAQIDGTSIDPLLYRADLWANRWSESYNNAIALITQDNGGNLIWQYGEAEHCDTCRSLNGIVASAKEWTTAGVKPQNAPNNLIDCGGWQCKCSLSPTSSRRSPKALDSIMNIIGARTL
jgi:hypothetical protein